MKSRPHARSTFLDVREILDQTRSYARTGREKLAEAMRDGERDLRTQILLDTIEEQRLALEQAMDRCKETVSDRMLETRAQYTIDLWGEQSELPRERSLEEAVQWVLELDQRLIETYRSLARRSGSEELNRFFASLVDLVEAHDRRLVRESQSIHDL